MLDHSVTIVLPVHNGERHIRSSVLDILELSFSISANLELVIVDNGSTDDTYETACELARFYPQIQVFRQRLQLNLEATMQLVRSRLSVDLMIVHDGSSPVDVAQLRRLLSDRGQLKSGVLNGLGSQAAVADENFRKTRGANRFASVRAVQQDMEQVHGSLLGFRWLQIEPPVVPRRRSGVLTVGIPDLASTSFPVAPPASV